MSHEFQNELGRPIRIEIEDVGSPGTKDQNRIAVIGPDSTCECFLTPKETQELAHALVEFLIGAGPPERAYRKGYREGFDHGRDHDGFDNEDECWEDYSRTGSDRP